MKTFVVLCALACSTLAAPRQLDQSQRNWQSREKKSPTFGSHLDSHGHGLDTSYHHGFHQPQFHQEHLGLKKPLFHHGHHDIHHSLGHGLGHHGHGFRSEEEEEKSSVAVTEVTALKSAEDINENLETGLESNIKMARVAVDNMRRDLAEMESTANARKQWKHSDSKTDSILHDNIETAKEALENVQTSFHNLQAMNNKKMSGKDAESVQDAQLEKMTEDERMAKWKSAIETIQRNVEIANNIKESFTSGTAEEQDKMLPSHEARSSMTKPVIVEAHKKPSIDKKSDTELEVSTSTKVEMRDEDNKQEDAIMKEKSSWHHKTEMKADAPAIEKHVESPMKASNDKESLPKSETFKTSMKTSEKEVLAKNGEKKIDSFEMEEQKSVDVKAADSSMATNKEHMKMHHQSHVVPIQMHETKKAREDIDVNETMEKSAHHDTHLHPKKATDGTILNTKATRKFGSDEVTHHDMNKQTEKNLDHHDKLSAQQSNRKSSNIDTTTLMKEREFDAKSSMRESDMDHQASEMRSSPVLLENENMEEKLKHDNMMSAKSIDTAMHPNMQSAMRATENMQMVKDPKHHESARSFGPASYGPSVAVSVPSYGPSGIVSGGYGSAAPSYGPSVAASAPAPVSYGVNVAASAPVSHYAAPASHSYGAPVSSYSSGAGASSSGSGISINLGGSGPSGAVGVFPNARVGGCAVPLLLSCSPSVVSGSLAKVQHSYSAPSASYGTASGPASYKTNEQLSSHTKRDVKVNKLSPKKARRSFTPILDKKF